MRKFPLFLMALAAAAPALAAPEVGARTGAPEELFAGIGEGVSDAELARVAAAAAAHPLGTLENPVRVGGPEGERAYIGRLRCADGQPPSVGARSEGGIGAYGTVVGRYRLDCGSSAPGRVELILDMYHEEHREVQAPAGFAIAAP
jgi:hypothetical protein